GQSWWAGAVAGARNWPIHRVTDPSDAIVPVPPQGMSEMCARIVTSPAAAHNDDAESTARLTRACPPRVFRGHFFWPLVARLGHEPDRSPSSPRDGSSLGEVASSPFQGVVSCCSVIRARRPGGVSRSAGGG